MTDQPEPDEPPTKGAMTDTFQRVPNRAELRKTRLEKGDEKPGRSRLQRVSRKQSRLDVREHERKWRQSKRRERRARLAELPEAMADMTHSAQSAAEQIRTIAAIHEARLRAANAEATDELAGYCHIPTAVQA